MKVLLPNDFGPDTVVDYDGELNSSIIDRRRRRSLGRDIAMFVVGAIVGAVLVAAAVLA